MLEKNPGIVKGAEEHELVDKFTEIFNRRWREEIDPKAKTSGLQAARWFYIIEAARKAGYTRGVTNDTISQYAKEHFEEGQPLFAPSGKFDTAAGRPVDGGGAGVLPEAAPGGGARPGARASARAGRVEAPPEFALEERQRREDPRAWYHASHEKLSEFAPREVKDMDSLGKWFTSSPEHAKKLYGPNVTRSELPSDLNLLEFDGNDRITRDFERILGGNAQLAKAAGFPKEARIL
jgi:hypothetical protein